MVPKLIDLLYGMALNGDRAAAEILLGRVIGKTPEAPGTEKTSESYDVDLGPNQDDPAHNPDPPAAGVLG
jgi:hypothetical protein